MYTRLVLAVLVCLLPAGVAPLYADEQAEGLKLVDKAIQAGGGDAKITKLQTATWKGKASFQEGGQQVDFTIDGTSQGFDKQRMEVEINAGGMQMKGVMVLNGDKGWFHNMTQNKVEEAPKDALPMVQNMFHALRASQVLTMLKGKEYKLSPLGEVKLDNKPVLGLKVTRKDYRDLDLFFDKETGQLRKTSIQLPERPGGQDVEWEILFDNYKDLSGVKHFTTITFQRGNNKLVLELSEVKAQEKLDDKTFDKPG